MTFDPFEKRISRDIRNRLCTAFLQALEDAVADPFYDLARDLLANAPDGEHREFIEGRIQSCTAVFTGLGLRESRKPVPAGPFDIAFQLWSRDLFFECHEWLEAFWRTARGTEKKAVQALIRCAGASVLFDAGRLPAARSSALKALDLVHEFEACLPPPFRREDLVPAMEEILKVIQ